MNVKIRYKDGSFWAFDCNEIAWNRKKKELAKVEKERLEIVDLGAFENVDLIIAAHMEIYNRQRED